MNQTETKRQQQDKYKQTKKKYCLLTEGFPVVPT